MSMALPGCLSGLRRFSLKPVGLQDSLEVELESLCSCDCPPPSPAADGGGRCAEGQGSFRCGACVCQPGFMGARCECSEESTLLSSCLAAADSEVCSGQGRCYCGQCVCHASSFGRIYGPYCECDDYSCARFRGELCGGERRSFCFYSPVVAERPVSPAAFPRRPRRVRLRQVPLRERLGGALLQLQHRHRGVRDGRRHPLQRAREVRVRPVRLLRARSFRGKVREVPHVWRRLQLGEVRRRRRHRLVNEDENGMGFFFFRWGVVSNCTFLT